MKSQPDTFWRPKMSPDETAICLHELDAEGMRAIWEICWLTGQPTTVDIRGTHMNYDYIRIGEHEFEGSWEDIAPRLIAWVKLLRKRKPNDPTPGPP